MEPSQHRAFTATRRLIVRGLVSAALVCAAAACGGATPTSPTPTAEGPAAPALPPPPSSLPPVEARPFPPVTRSARVYVYERSDLAVSEYTRHSRYVLYDDGAFSLQYVSSRGSFQYEGTYEESNGTITFHWQGWSLAGPWGATGMLDGDCLTVRYNVVMALSDFEGATYRRAP